MVVIKVCRDLKDERIKEKEVKIGINCHRIFSYDKRVRCHKRCIRGQP